MSLLSVMLCCSHGRHKTDFDICVTSRLVKNQAFSTALINSEFKVPLTTNKTIEYSARYKTNHLVLLNLLETCLFYKNTIGNSIKLF